ncbi:MAG: ParB/RepB/Spo0J family partition protein [Clostridia bacterium]|nr:ParB/RepB/Spo0J family partition protein [Clostridia bacterium]
MSKPQAERAVARIPLQLIDPNPDQPRRAMDPESVRDLAESIRRHGQLSPVLVRARGPRYELIAGQRRLRALRLLGRGSAEAIVLSVGDCDSALIALVENLQREDLHFLDAAEACRRILEQHPITQEKLAASLSVSPSALANRLRLLRLPEAVRQEVRRLGLTERHARALLKAGDEERQLELARQAAERRMSVKQLEGMIGQKPKDHREAISPVVRDNRIIINAVMDTVKELNHIGIQVIGRVEERDDRIDVVVTIPIRRNGT